jgi:hypothetical protein
MRSIPGPAPPSSEVFAHVTGDGPHRRSVAPARESLRRVLGRQSGHQSRFQPGVPGLELRGGRAGRSGGVGGGGGVARRSSGEHRRFLDEYAAKIESRSEALAEVARARPRCPRARFRQVELPHDRSAPAGARQPGSFWCRATIDRGQHSPKYGPLGQWSSSGPIIFLRVQLDRWRRFRRGDRGGNPVIGKANTGHRRRAGCLPSWRSRPPGNAHASRDGAAHLPHAAGSGAPARVTPSIGATGFTGAGARVCG